MVVLVEKDELNPRGKHETTLVAVAWMRPEPIPPWAPAWVKSRRPSAHTVH